MSAFLSLILTNLRFFSLASLSITAYTTLNIVSKIPASLISIAIFGQPLTALQIGGYIVAFVGAFGYAYFGQTDVFHEEKALVKKKGKGKDEEGKRNSRKTIGKRKKLTKKN